MESNRAQTGAPSEKLQLLKHLLAQKGINVPREQVIGKRSGAGPRRLSFAQQRLWVLNRLNPGSPAYNLCNALRLEGPLDLGALEKTLAEVVRRQESLRTTFIETDQGPMQVIAAPAPAPTPLIDLSQLAAPEAETELRRLMIKESLTPFDIERGPLFRVTLFRLAERDHVAMFIMHHIISDGWSMELLAREVSALYNAFSSGASSPLEDLPIQYADYAEWQRDWLQGERLDRQLDYWKKRLASLPPPLDPPADRPRPAVETFEGGNHSFLLTEDLSKKLRTFAERQGATLFMVMLAAFQAFLSRLSGREDIIVGSYIANRRRPELEGIIGFFVNTLVFRIDLTGNPTFREITARAREAALGAYDNQDAPFEKLVEELRPERVKDRNPIFQIGFTLRHAPRHALNLPGLNISVPAIGGVITLSDLSLEILDTPRGLNCMFVYKKELFSPGAVRRMAERFQVMLEAIAEDPERRLYDLSPLTPGEREKLVVEWNQTSRELPQGRLLHHLIEDQAALNPDKIAVLAQRQPFSFHQLNSRANQLARHLRSLGVGPESPVAICLPRSFDALMAALAVLKAGGCYVPVELNLPFERQSYIFEDARVSAVITRSDCEHRLASGWGTVIALDEQEERIGRWSETNLDIEMSDQNLAYIIYTSGSTGQPKGVMIPHRGVINYLLWSRESYRADEGRGSIAHSPLGFDLTVTSLWTPLAAGQTVRLAEEGEGVESLKRELKDGSDYTLLKLTPSHLEMLRWEMRGEPLEGKARVMVIGGEELRWEKVREWRGLAPGTRLINEYGPTETVVGCSVYEVGRDDDGEGVAPIGRPIWNTRMYVLDKRGELAGIGVEGEICVGGVGVGRGYVGKASETAELFVPDEYGGERGARLYRTGDLGRVREDGVIEYVGRRDGQVKLRGYRIELGEIEEKLRKVKGVREAVAAVKGEGTQRRLVGYVVEDERGEVRESEIRERMERELPEYMRPSAYVKVREIPLSVNGKVDREALPGWEREESEVGEYEEARTPVEREVAEIWKELLGLKRVGIHDNFFELGGHSLLLIQLATRVSKIFNVEIPLGVLFDVPTIYQMTLAIAELQLAQEESLEAGDILEEIKGLSPEEVKALLEAEAGVASLVA